MIHGFIWILFIALFAENAMADPRASYYVNGEIHVNEIGKPEGKPLTMGHMDFKPSWSKTGNQLVFFRRTKDDPIVNNWKSAICVINIDGSGFHQLTDGTQTILIPPGRETGLTRPSLNERIRPRAHSS
jgi:hypothetical protein